jgi:hypothetical protein
VAFFEKVEVFLRLACPLSSSSLPKVEAAAARFGAFAFGVAFGAFAFGVAFGVAFGAFVFVAGAGRSAGWSLLSV